MASISHDENTGRRRIQFVAGDGVRKTIRLGRMTSKQAETIKLFVEDIIACKLSGTSPRSATSEWLAALPDTMHTRLERVGLVPPRDRANAWTIAAWVRKYIEAKVDATESTKCNMIQAERTLVEYLGADKLLTDVTAADAAGYASFLRARKCQRGSTGRRMAEATVRRQCRRAKQFLEGAVDALILSSNPFRKLRCADVVDKSRERDITEAEIKSLLEVCPDLDWKLILSLAYYAGLRCPSEIAALTWADVNWDTNHLLIKSQKTHRDSKSGVREAPICPELLTLLLKAFSEAQEGAQRVVSRPLSKANLRTTLYKLMDRAGIQRFAKPFQNMRCTAETNWIEANVPEFLVSKWIGHDVAVSRRHYDIIRRKHADRVIGGGAESGAQTAQNPAQQAAAPNRMKSQLPPEPLAEHDLCEVVQSGTTECNLQSSPTRT